MAERLFESERQRAEVTNPSLRMLCEARRSALKYALGRLEVDGAAKTRQDIQLALDALDGLLTGNLDKIPPVIAAQLTRWIESSKFLGAKEAREMAAETGGAKWPSS